MSLLGLESDIICQALFSASKSLMKLFGGVVSYIYFFILAAKTGVHNCSHHTFRAIVMALKLLLQCFIEFLWMQ